MISIKQRKKDRKNDFDQRRLFCIFVIHMQVSTTLTTQRWIRTRISKGKHAKWLRRRIFTLGQNSWWKQTQSVERTISPRGPHRTRSEDSDHVTWSTWADGVCSVVADDLSFTSASSAGGQTPAADEDDEQLLWRDLFSQLLPRSRMKQNPLN